MKIKVGGTRKSAKVYEFNALACIDRVPGFPDGCRIDRKPAAHVAEKKKQVWLSRYLRPSFIGHDNGGEFIGPEYGHLLENFAITDVHTTSCNPTGNSIIERVHLTIGSSGPYPRARTQDVESG